MVGVDCCYHIPIENEDVLLYSANPTFDVDIRHLEARYKRLQKDLHPDKFGNREAKEQEYSAEQSSLVNHAYVKLKSPLQRALYLVSHLRLLLGRLK